MGVRKAPAKIYSGYAVRLTCGWKVTCLLHNLSRRTNASASPSTSRTDTNTRESLEDECGLPVAAAVKAPPILHPHQIINIHLPEVKVATALFPTCVSGLFLLQIMKFSAMFLVMEVIFYLFHVCRYEF